MKILFSCLDNYSILRPQIMPQHILISLIQEVVSAQYLVILTTSPLTNSPTITWEPAPTPWPSPATLPPTCRTSVWTPRMSTGEAIGGSPTSGLWWSTWAVWLSSSARAVPSRYVTLSESISQKINQQPLWWSINDLHRRDYIFTSVYYSLGNPSNLAMLKKVLKKFVRICTIM